MRFYFPPTGDEKDKDSEDEDDDKKKKKDVTAVRMSEVGARVF